MRSVVLVVEILAVGLVVFQSMLLFSSIFKLVIFSTEKFSDTVAIRYQSHQQ